MTRQRRFFAAGFLTACLSGAILGPTGACAATIRVAVSANFAECCEALTSRFEAATGHRVVMSRGSTGRHYAQIRAGAPFDVFLAADSHRPTLLEDEGHAVAGSRFTYAEGRLALWLPAAGPGEDRSAASVLMSADFHHLAIANPRLAPYGLAAQQALESLELWEDLQSRLVIGQSAGQAWQFVASGNAEAGIVAYPQILAADPVRGKWWTLDAPLHAPILQQAVLLTGAESPAAAALLLDYLRSPEAALIMVRFGYLIPER
jgi:molybdate transport system substrate-binding protein